MLKMRLALPLLMIMVLAACSTLTVPKTVTKTFDVKSTAKPNAPTSLTFTVTCTDGCVITETTGE